MAVDPAFIASFKAFKWDSGDNMVVVPNGTSRPILVRVGNHFLGAIMPVRLPGERGDGGGPERVTEDWPNWADLAA